MKGAAEWLRAQWAKNNIISGVLAVAIWGTIIALALMGRDIPPILATAGGAIIMTFYRGKDRE